MSFFAPTTMRRARFEEIGVVIAGVILYAIGMGYLGWSAAPGLQWLIALPVVGMGLIFMALIAYATHQEDVREHARPPGESIYTGNY